MKLNTTPIAITMGDASGIGPEIILKAMSKDINSDLIIIGDAYVIKNALKLYESTLRLNIIKHVNEALYQPKTINLIESSYLKSLPPLGKVNSESGLSAFKAIKKGIKLAKLGEVAAIVTAPINKQALFSAGINFPGHTEILAEYADVKNVAMMLANNELRTVMVTIHCSLKNAIVNADFDAQIRAIKFAHEGCKQLGIKYPRIAVAGLNPHAGENGLFGNEEHRIIIPAIEHANNQGFNVSGPWPGDTVFMQARKGKFDVVVAQYHDQGLIPIKYLGIEDGVNITLGLPFIRTSPDHGTAFDIAGKNIASSESIETSIRFAKQMAQIKKES